MSASPSAHVDTYCRDNLPPESDWPELLLDRPELTYPDRLNCATALLDDTARALGAERPCLLVPGGDTWSYAQLLSTANRIANLLTTELGVVPGNRVLLRGPNAPWLVACWFGVLKAGGVVVATMPMLRARELADIHDIARIDLALCDHRLLDDLAAGLPGVRTIAYGDSGPDDLTALVADQPDTHADVATASDDVALLAFTSGTTGRPKATMHFHRDVLAIATRSRRRSCGRSATMSSPARRRWRSPSASGGWWCS